MFPGMWLAQSQQYAVALQLYHSAVLAATVNTATAENVESRQNQNAMLLEKTWHDSGSSKAQANSWQVQETDAAGWQHWSAKRADAVLRHVCYIITVWLYRHLTTWCQQDVSMCP
jgi:hypothetical protein